MNQMDQVRVDFCSYDLYTIFRENSQKENYTVVTPNKGQSIFSKIGSNKGISETPLFVVFHKWYEIRDFSVQIRQEWQFTEFLMLYLGLINPVNPVNHRLRGLEFQ